MNKKINKKKLIASLISGALISFGIIIPLASCSTSNSSNNNNNNQNYKIDYKLSNNNIANLGNNWFSLDQKVKLSLSTNINSSGFEYTVNSNNKNNINIEKIDQSNFNISLIDPSKVIDKLEVQLEIKLISQNSILASKIVDIVFVNQNKITHHQYSLDKISAFNSSFDFITNSFEAKQAYKNLINELKNGYWPNNGGARGADFMYTSNKEKSNKFYQLNQEIGVYGDYGNDFLEKMKYAPANWTTEYTTKQKYLDNFTEQEKNNAILKTVNIDQLILNNQFGFLPSNLSQLLYYLDLNSISKIFGINNLKNIKMNFDDEKCTADILLIDKNDQSYLLNYSKNNSNNLKSNYDFRKYIYDRTFKIRMPAQFNAKAIVPQTGVQNSYMALENEQSNATAWILDRIINNKLPQDKYQFLIATNMHVLDFNYGFNKSRAEATDASNYSTVTPTYNPGKLAKTYNDNWDGGFRYEGGINASGADKIIREASNTNYYPYYKIISRSPEKTREVELYKPNLDDPDSVNDQTNLNSCSTGINFANAIDAIWYTPNFLSSGIYSQASTGKLGPFMDYDSNVPKFDKNNLSTGYQKINGRWVGKNSNSGADFVIAKITLKKSDIDKLLPTLANVLNTPEEKDWYVKFGDETNKITTVSPNSTLFIGGYPYQEWKTLKSIGGKINSQKRYFDSSDPILAKQSYWTRYNEQDNIKYNTYTGLVDWYKNRFTSPSLTKEQNDKYFQHGMQVTKVLQQSYIELSNENHYDTNNVLKKGASGSMMINSRFELSGIIFGYSYNSNNQFVNFAMLLKNYTEENKNLNFMKEIKEKLKSEGLTSVKLFS